MLPSNAQPSGLQSEKGLRKVGSIGPWHPARVSYRVPMAGQTGFFNRIVYNSKIVAIQDPEQVNNKSGFHKYGVVKNPCIILRGHVQGPSKRQIILTTALRPTKKQSKKDYEFIELR